jgi:basic membrane lipoprotein Med (substrate-binding protein (PBP1-ABC) superfamily)
MVLVNRAPNGNPGNSASGLQNAQDAAWLAGLKYAQTKVFIQSPTLNAGPVVEGILNAVRRGIECTLYIDVGFNDGGEALPGQGGTNEEVSKSMFTQLADEEKEKLKLYWYTGTCFSRDGVIPSTHQ